MIAGLLGLFVSGFFAGAACYINLVEHAARLGLEDRALLTEWKAAYRRGVALQAPLAFLGFAVGILAWFQTRQPPFLVGGLLMLANWPWTLLAIMRVNKVLMATAAEDAGPASRALILFLFVR
jgi:Domain of unknown function (DUF1772)